MPILDLQGIRFHAVVVFGLGKDLLFKSVLGRCALLLEVALIFKYSGFDFCGEQLNISIESIEKGKTNVERSFLWVIQYSIFSENRSRKVAFTSHVIEIFVSSLQNPITYLHYQIIDEHILQISEYITNLLHPHENHLGFRLSFIFSFYTSDGSFRILKKRGPRTFVPAVYVGGKNIRKN